MSVTPSLAHIGAPIVKRIAGTITGTTALAIWTPDTGKRVRLHGIAVQGKVTTILAAATVSDPIWLAQTSVSTPLIEIGKIVAADDAAGLRYGTFYFNMDSGYQLTAANAALVINTASGITTGVIQFNGFVWGDEV